MIPADIGAFADVRASKASFAQLQQQEYVHYEDLPLSTKDGRLISVEFVSDVYEVEGSKVIQCNIRDITERKNAQEEIKRLNTELAARAHELELANEDLKAFNHTVAHDLRQPLNVLGLYCQSMKMLCQEQLSEDCRGYVQNTHDTTMRMNHLIETLLKFSHVGQVASSFEAVDLSAIAYEVAQEPPRYRKNKRIRYRPGDSRADN
jgi:signal transduction histidine kinase